MLEFIPFESVAEWRPDRQQFDAGHRKEMNLNHGIQLTIKLLICFLALQIVTGKQKDVSLSKVIIEWRYKLRQWPQFHTISQQWMSRNSESVCTSTKKKFMTSMELEDYELDQGRRRLWSQAYSDTEGSNQFCIRKVCKDMPSEIYGDFSQEDYERNSLNGAVRLVYANGLQHYLSMRKTSFCGPMVDFYKDGKTRNIGIHVSNQDFTGGLHFHFTYFWLGELITVVTLRQFHKSEKDSFGCIVSKTSSRPDKMFCGQFVDNVATNFEETDPDDVDLSMYNDSSWPELKIRKRETKGEENGLTFRPIMDLIQSPDDLLDMQATFFFLRSKPQNDTLFENEKDMIKYKKILNTWDKNCSTLFRNFNDNKFMFYSVRKISRVGPPGSGGKWLNFLLMRGTGLLGTATDFEEKTHFDGVFGKNLWLHGHHDRAFRHTGPMYTDPYRFQEDLDWRMNDIVAYDGRAVILIRDPLRSTVSYWNHIKLRSGTAVNSNLVNEVKTPEFQNFIEAEIRHWFEVVAEWVSIGSNVTVVYFENLKKDPIKEVRKILNFFKLDVQEDRLKCLRHEQTNVFKRPKSKFQVTPEDLNQNLKDKFTMYIGKLRNVLKEFGYNVDPMDSYELAKI